MFEVVSVRINPSGWRLKRSVIGSYNRASHAVSRRDKAFRDQDLLYRLNIKYNNFTKKRGGQKAER